MRTKYTIHEPIWNGGNRCFGVADFRLSGFEGIDVTCDYKNKDGEVVLPEIYGITSVKAKTFPHYYVKDVKIYKIPVTEFEVMEKKSEPLFEQPVQGESITDYLTQIESILEVAVEAPESNWEMGMKYIREGKAILNKGLALLEKESGI